MRTAALLLAAGSGTRLQAGGNKVFVDVAGTPLLVRSARALAACDAIDELVVVAQPDERARVAAVVADARLRIPLRTAAGGATRAASELGGLEALASEIEADAIDVVLIHDAARPFVSSALIDRVVRTARAVGGAVPAVPLGDVYRHTADGRLDDRGLADRDLRRAQTPQGFRARELLQAYRRAVHDDAGGLDTAQTVQRHTDLDVAAVPGEPTNIKVTYADDLRLAERIAAELTGG